MGTYLSTPVLDKCVEIGSSNQDGEFPVSWAVADMQGWRKSMEDAHIATADVDLPGGFVGVKAAKGEDYLHPPDGGDRSGGEQGADKDDEEKEQESVGEEDESGPNAEASATGDNPPAATAAPVVVPDRARVFAVFDGHGGPEVARFCQLYLVDVLTKTEGWRGPQANRGKAGGGKAGDIVSEEKEVDAKEEGKKSDSPEDELNRRIGEALVDCFHAVDRMIDDPSRREEIALLRVEKPRLGETRSISTGGSHAVEYSAGASHAFPLVVMDSVGTAAAAEPETEKNENDKEKGSMSDEDGGVTTDESRRQSRNNDKEDDDKKDEANADLQDEKDAEKDADEVTKEAEGKLENHQNGQLQGSGEDGDDSDGNTNKDKNDLVGTANKGDHENDKGGMGVSAADAVSLFRKLLTGQATTTEDVQNGDVSPGSTQGGTLTTGQVMGPSVTQPTRIQNGRQVCNLPDHPVHAGCTSVVAVMVGNILTVANAGDSRAVLCREGGRTEALSFDHKPMQERERTRITEAGGFVNQFGRVNGNLNLSRSIGDLKYKQVPGIPPSGQMITAEPDITQVTVNPGRDEFLILGCDGIWDCLTNEEAVQYVRDRIDSITPVDIAKEMLDEIVSEDPRASQGIGGDNMTLLIADLLPTTRSYYGRGGVEDEAEASVGGDDEPS